MALLGVSVMFLRLSLLTQARRLHTLSQLQVQALGLSGALPKHSAAPTPSKAMG